MMKLPTLALATVLAAIHLSVGARAQAAEAAPSPSLIPWPTDVQVGEGVFTLTAETVIVADAASQASAAQLAGFLAPATGFALKFATGSASHPHGIALVQDAGLTDLGTEGYTLTATADQITLAAPTQAGLFHAFQTLRQLLPPAIFADHLVSDIPWQLPCVRIKDKPRFGWRGLMLDTGHDFQPLPFVLRFIDLMALHKFNTLHWHITDLGTWPLEINGYPKLIEPFTRGTRQMGNPKRGVKPGHYSQDEVRQVVRYAAERHITIVPEIDMPGHSTPALTAYPEFDCPVPFKTWEWDHWEYCVGNEKTYGFLQDVLTEVMDLFPSTIIHIGGDECPTGHWHICPICQAKKKAENLQTDAQLQTYFTQRIATILAARGRRLIGWDEILQPGLADDAVIMAWRPTIHAEINGAKSGHDVVVALSSHLYFDYPESRTPLAKVYSFEPVPTDLTPQQAARILGAQAQMWTDNHPTTTEIEHLVYPRACALAEGVWSPAATRDFGRFTSALTIHRQRLAVLGIE